MPKVENMSLEDNQDESAELSEEEEKDEDGPAVIHKIGKGARMEKEKKFKKWNGMKPDDQMKQQLKKQMTPCFSESMIKKLFHDNFKYHIRAIGHLSKAISSNRPALIESLDMILRWFSLRFFDTNTTVLLKSLEFLESLFDMLAEEEYNMSEYEGSAFVPYLVLKIGDQIEKIKNSVHNLFWKLTKVYPIAKLFACLLDCVKSNDSPRTRIECLDELGAFMSQYGMDVCEASQAKALEIVAKQIGNKDSGVRSAALNAILEAYNIVGEEVVNLVGELNERDLSFLENRIKQAGKAKLGVEIGNGELAQYDEIFKRHGHEAEVIKRPNQTLKWDSKTPREEMVQQLKDQMTPCFSESMIEKLFHDDFKFHIEAIALLSKAISSNRPALIESLDMILRWFSLRFFDTSTNILRKSLEFLESLFDMLAEEDYKMSEYEGSAFVPYLVLKIGDQMDSVRKSVRNLFKKLTDIYPATKLFTHLLGGLASKKLKTRMECLTELGFLISKFGMEVCQPSPPKALKEMATQIGDRDNGVRSAALNAIVEAYNIVGEQVYKLIGRLSDKDRSYLEERIKRAGRAKPAAPPETKKPEQKQLKPNKKSITEVREQVESDVVAVSKMKACSSSIKKNLGGSSDKQDHKVNSEFVLDYCEIGTDVLKVKQPDLLVIDYREDDFAMNTPVVAGKTSTTTAARDISGYLDLTIAQIANSDVSVSMEALAQFEEVFKRHSEETEIVKKIDQYLQTCLVQFRILFSRHLDSKEYSYKEVIRLLKYLLNGIMTTFTTKSLSKAVSKDVLKDVTAFLLTSTHNSKLTNLEECDTVIKTINILMLKIIQNSDHTSCFWALIKLLMDGIEQEQSQNIQDLYLKCLWKLARFLPDIIQDLHVDAVLLDIHIFLKEYPSSYWKTKKDQRPMSTVTVFLRTLMKLIGPELLNKTVLIEDEDASELVAFLKRSFQKRTEEEAPVKPTSRPPTLSKPLSGAKNEDVDAMDILQDIFKKIGSTENNQEGLTELYEFKEKYPEVDVEPFIARTSQFFRNYVERGLKAIEKERRSSSNISSSVQPKSRSTTSQLPTSSAVNGSGAEKYLDPLNVLREKYMQLNTKPDTVESTEKKEKEEVNIDDLKRRLQQIKMGSRT